MTMQDLVAQVPGWVQYVGITGFVVLVLSRLVFLLDSRLKQTKTGLLIGDGSVTITVMMTLAFIGADDRLLQEFGIVTAVGAVLFLWDTIWLYARRHSTPHERLGAIQASDAWPPTTEF
jgi:uncharacterized membrane protein